MATIKDVAMMAGVSVSTVSYAISGRRLISAERKAHIEAAMKKLHYRPHAIARGLASKKTRIIAILFPSVEHGIGLSELELILSAAKSATEQGYHLVIWTLQTNKPEELRQLLEQELVDGVILMEVHLQDKRINVLKKLDIPFILLGRDKERPTENFIDVDFYTTMRRCITYLIELGHRKLIFVNQSETSFRNGYGPQVRTHEAFEALCQEAGLEGKELFCGSDPARIAGMVEGTLAEYPEVTALITMNDKALPGIIRGIEKRKLKIPADISVVSIVSCGDVASMFLPSITAFELNTPLLMSLTVNQLIARLEDRRVDLDRRLIPCEFRERQSTGRARSIKQAKRRV